MDDDSWLDDLDVPVPTSFENAHEMDVDDDWFFRHKGDSPSRGARPARSNPPSSKSSSSSCPSKENSSKTKSTGKPAVQRVQFKPMLTVPKTPCLRSTKRNRRLPPESPLEARRFYRPPPHYGVPFRPKKELKSTKPQPFSFEKREPSANHMKTIHEDENSEDTENKDVHIFKARPAPHTKPFQVKHGVIPPTKPLESHLPNHGQTRAQSRAAFDAELAQRRAELMRAHNERIARNEQARRLSMRSRATFKASGIRHFRVVQINKCSKTTKAHSPKFSERLQYADKHKKANPHTASQTPASAAAVASSSTAAAAVTTSCSKSQSSEPPKRSTHIPVPSSRPSKHIAATREPSSQTTRSPPPPTDQA